jgi:DNA-binding winged helix-turn-helix (wHTH) protein
MPLRFGDCGLDLETRQLFRGGKPVHLPPKTFRLLEILLAERPKAISKETLIESVWPGVFVSESNLARLVAELREAIGDDAQAPKFVRTVHGFGYAFQADALELAPRGRAEGPVFKLIWGDREIRLAPGENILGRDPDSLACLDVASVSRHHARIVIGADHATLEDLGSKNGTFLRGRRVESRAALTDGDDIRIGSVPLTFRRFSAGGTTETVRSR